MQQLAVKKRHSSGESFHRFPSSKIRQKQWLASMKLLNPPVLKHAVVYNISCFTNISTGICIKCLIFSQHEKGKYHSLSYKIETAKVILVVSHDPIFTEKKYIFKQYCNIKEG